MKRFESFAQVFKSLFHAIAICLLVSGMLFSASTTSFAKSETDSEALKQLSADFERQFNERRGPEFLRLKAITTGPMGALNADPNMELVGVKEDGRPIFHKKDNVNAARSIGTDEVHPGGETGFDVTGSLIFFMSVWDGGAVRNTHQELAGRVILQNNVAFDDHATHVAGTMIASGVSASAKGMAPAAYVNSYDWNNDESEMAAGAAGTLLLSNHSYGFPCGWEYTTNAPGTGWYWYGNPTVSQTEDHEFGLYDSNAREWDIIANNAPYYTIVKSAGNHRGEGPGPGGQHWVWSGGWTSSTTTRDRDGGTQGYDCMNGQTVAKNIISCGATNDVLNYTGPYSVSISSFSSFGPTDDGRIKPDVVANGVGVRSSTANSNTSYDTYDGTSMSAPSLTGSLGLVLKYYKDSHNFENPLATTMKGIVIHTAREAGSHDGPDYRYGWGLAYIPGCFELVQQDSAMIFPIQEMTLSNGEELVYEYVSDGETPAKVTIVWNDPAGYTGGGLNVRTPKLINDLDLRLTHVDTDEEYFPFFLDPDNPSAAAQQGDNVVDNVEQVLIAAPPEGVYEISVSHKGTLSSPQDFSMIVTGLLWSNDPRIAPSNVQGDLDYTNGNVTLTWEHVEPPANFNEFRIYRDGSAIGYTTDLTFVDNLTEFGKFEYEVRAHYTEDGESPFNEKVELFYKAPSGPDFVNYLTQDEDNGEIMLYWDTFLSESVRYDDDSDESSIVLGPSFEVGAKVGTRFTAMTNGSVVSMQVLFEGTASNPLGPVKLHLYDEGVNDNTPGEVLYSTDEIVLTENGWLKVPVGVPHEVSMGDDYWVVVEWLEMGRSEVRSDTDGEIQDRGYLSLDGETFEGLDTIFSGFLDGNPMIRADVGTEYDVDDYGLYSYTIFRDDNIIAEDIVWSAYNEVLPGDGTYEYVIQANYYQGTSQSAPFVIDANALGVDEELILPGTFEIGAAYPNPFNPSVSVPVKLGSKAAVNVRIFDILGRQVAELNKGTLDAGSHTMNWNAENLASGVYFLNIQAGTETAIRKVVLMR